MEIFKYIFLKDKYKLKSEVDYKAIFSGLGNDDLIDALESFIVAYKQKATIRDGPAIPLNLFSKKKLGILELISKYLRENSGLSYSEIANLINRDDRTIWAAYNDATFKHPKPLKSDGESIKIPCSIFQDRSCAPLEALSIYLHDDLKLSFNEISKELNRSYRTIWISYKNGKKKRLA